jgi:hypothetical protein
MKPEKQVKKDEASLGTEIAARERARANTLTDAEREELFNQGMALIYGGSERAKTTTHRS